MIFFLCFCQFFLTFGILHSNWNKDFWCVLSLFFVFRCLGFSFKHCAFSVFRHIDNFRMLICWIGNWIGFNLKYFFLANLDSECLGVYGPPTANIVFFGHAKKCAKHCTIVHVQFFFWTRICWHNFTNAPQFNIWLRVDRGHGGSLRPAESVFLGKYLTSYAGIINQYSFLLVTNFLGRFVFLCHALLLQRRKRFFWLVAHDWNDR